MAQERRLLLTLAHLPLIWAEALGKVAGLAGERAVYLYLRELRELVHEQMTSSGIVGPRDVGSRPSGTVIRASVDNGHYRRPVLRLH